MRVSHPANSTASNLSLEQSYLKAAMVGKGEKSEKRGGPENLGTRVVKKESGNSGKLLLVDRKYRVIGGEVALVGKEVDWKVYKGLKKVVGSWENDKVRLEDKMILVNSEWGMSGKGNWESWQDEMEGVEGSEDNSMVAVEEAIRELRKEEGDKRLIKIEKIEEKREEEVVEEISNSEDECYKKGKLDKGKEVEKVEMVSSGIEELSMVEKLKLEKKIKEKQEREERKKREKEEILNRKEWKDYDETVEDARYILGIRKEEGRYFMLDREIKKVLELGLERGLGQGRGLKEEKEEVLVRSEVVVENRLKEKEELKKEVVVEGGRSYSEVLGGSKEKDRESEKLEEKKEKEMIRWLEDSLERERRRGKVVEVVMDS
ncbi:hypothetical protein B9Z19DRAFT_1159781 [Tuber borchii]|uniref:Uncharacterized protein n=1 Tax=Tuber borchii TaxID=42251 RepID=A0A2T6ZFA4_TUBBO|nr:hypothetical protein B9Z19DRAFT_1159781 [Tuber borchii]